MIKLSERPEVHVGDIYRSTDKRRSMKPFRVDHVDSDVMASPHWRVRVTDLATNTTRWLWLHNLRSYKYVLVQSAATLTADDRPPAPADPLHPIERAASNFDRGTNDHWCESPECVVCLPRRSGLGN